jgi:adenylate cyclase
MALKEILAEINDDIKDIVTMSFELTQTQSDYVPNDEDPGLTFESGKAKKAKLIETCVLYADMRNSVQLSKTQSKEVMARLYTAFISSVIYVAHHHDGIIRNIIGDRVMVVFPKRNCFTNAVNTAVSINTIASKIINRHFKGFDFKVGIGIDFGEMKVIKAGISKQGKERSSHKNLVWIGNPANIASRLTDIANKEITRPVYRVTRNLLNPKAYRPLLSKGPLDVIQNMGKRERVSGEPEYLPTTEIVDFSPEEFAKSIYQSASNGIISTLGGKMLKFERIEKKEIGAAILMTQSVWQGYAAANPEIKDVKEKMWSYQNVTIKEYSGKIVGSGIYWSIVDQIPN